MSRNTLESHQTCGQTGGQTGQWNADLAEHMSRLRSPMPPGTVILGIYSSRLGSFVSICRSNQGAARMTAITRRTREKLAKLIQETDHRDAGITVIYADAWIDLLHTALRGMLATTPILAWAGWAAIMGRHGLPGSTPSDLMAALAIGISWSAVKVWQWHELLDQAVAELTSTLDEFQPRTLSPPTSATHLIPGQERPTMLIHTDPAPPRQSPEQIRQEKKK